MPPTDTRTTLLETALELIWSSNYNSVGVNEMCKRAGVTKGCFYHHFDSKVELFCQATEYYWEKIKQDLDALLSPINSPLEQLEKWIALIFSNKIGDDIENMPGCAFFNAGAQTGCGEARITETLQLMMERGAKYNLALVRNLESGGYLTPVDDAQQIARLMQQYIHGFISYSGVARDMGNARKDLPVGIYRLIGLKTQYWHSIIDSPASSQHI